jgi:hypothetical protein
LFPRRTLSDVPVGREARRAARLPRVEAVFGEATAAALDLLELTELAWHDCYDEISPSEEIIDEILLCSEGELALLVKAARLAVTDWRDLKMWGEGVRKRVTATGGA